MRLILTRLVISLTCLLAVHAADAEPPAEQLLPQAAPAEQSLPESPQAPVIAVADFTGADRDEGRFIAETLLTDLAQSKDLRLVERSQIRKALDELKLEDSGIVDTRTGAELGKMLQADELVVGSYREGDDGQLVVNARVLDIATGRIVPGSAANVTGFHGELLFLTHKLAHQLLQRLTGADQGLTSDARRPGYNYNTAAPQSNGYYLNYPPANAITPSQNYDVPVMPDLDELGLSSGDSPVPPAVNYSAPTYYYVPNYSTAPTYYSVPNYSSTPTYYGNSFAGVGGGYSVPYQRAVRRANGYSRPHVTQHSGFGGSVGRRSGIVIRGGSYGGGRGYVSGRSFGGARSFGGRGGHR